MADAVHYFVPNNPAVARTLRQKLLRLRAEVADQVAIGSAVDWADYRYNVGYIRGLEAAIAMCEETEKDMES